MEEILNQYTNEKKIIMVGSKWCGPCKILLPYFNSFSNMDKYKHIKFIKLDFDHDLICEELNINKLPTFIYYNENLEVYREYAIKDAMNLQKFINNIN